MNSKLILDYQSYGYLLDSLVHKIGIRFKPTHIYSQPRGGWPVGVHLSHHLNAPMLETGWWRNRTLDQASEIRVLFADDIVDHGDTLIEFHRDIHFFKHLRTFDFFTCSLITKPHAAEHPMEYALRVADFTWVVFPWEKIEEAEADQKIYLQGRGKE